MKPSERIEEIYESICYGTDRNLSAIQIKAMAIIRFLDEQYTKQEEDWRAIPCEKHKFERSCECGKPSESSTPIVEECGERCMCCTPKDHSDSISSCCSGTCKCHTSNKKI